MDVRYGSLLVYGHTQLLAVVKALSSIVQGAELYRSHCDGSIEQSAVNNRLCIRRSITIPATLKLLISTLH